MNIRKALDKLCQSEFSLKMLYICVRIAKEKPRRNHPFSTIPPCAQNTKTYSSE
jgi:hypothetical protein